MGVFGDLFRLGRAGVKQTLTTDYAENLRQSADLAERFVGQDPDAPVGTHGAASANPFTNLTAYGNMLQASGTVVSLAKTGADVAGTPVYAVQLSVTLPGAEAYPTTYQTVIAEGALHNWQPGRVLPFRVSPTDPHSLLLG